MSSIQKFHQNTRTGSLGIVFNGLVYMSIELDSTNPLYKPTNQSFFVLTAQISQIEATTYF